ncbi:ADP-glyceromanno-heptose 6-epimerase [Occallatibacter riparius]|uniref:ADP-glyceromanno-heptose 6-epimerase n=1 Tax=Occallatibacter riparius TaxID=1002689 RepID=A0A9J7BSG5_9BACT|nr:ADP-glyceromanno-heptose 6-epimerase [Occallatibacter riparius]UWZ85535.1 ADP-glyceromanno-heptose 6-epimerase [Occallatibacter riparius]
MLIHQGIISQARFVIVLNGMERASFSANIVKLAEADKVCRIVHRGVRLLYIVTGGAGFIGSNLVHELNSHGTRDILIVDSVADRRKLENLEGAQYVELMDKSAFRRAIRERSLGTDRVEAILHQGACSNTLEDDDAYLMDNNCEYSKDVLRFAADLGAPFVFASTAAVYGAGGPGRFALRAENEHPLNMYGHSKLMFDNYFRGLLASGALQCTAVGLRYFNVYGAREGHKGRMASVVHQFRKQMAEHGRIRIFKGSGGYGDGQQRRDFVYVRDLARLNMFFAQIGPYAPGRNEPAKVYHGLANAGSGVSRSFNDVARALMNLHGDCPVDYLPFPPDLEGRYQHFTEADLSSLRELGYHGTMMTLEEGLADMHETCNSAAS